jgi:hypothetical protein
VKNAQTGAALPGAAVSISQMLNGKHPKTVIATSGSNGTFSAEVFNDTSTITVSSTNFINNVISKSSFSGNENLGEINLSPISGAMITLDMSYTYSAEAGITPIKSTLPPDYINLRFAVYNQTQGKEITNFVYQHPNLILLDGANTGDTIRVSVSGGSGDFNAVQANAVLDNALRAAVTLNMLQHGSARMSLTSSANDENVALVYNASGKLVKAYDFHLTTVSTDPMPDGSYSVVFMGKSLFFDSIQNLSDLTAAKLVQDVDYARRQVSVTSGVIARINAISIPKFDESKFYYTDNDKTLFSANKASAVAGSYFTLRSQLAFKDAYKNQVSDVKLIVKLPNDCVYIENSVIYGPNNTPATHSLVGDTLTVYLTNVEDVVRFCVIPSASGKYAPNAFVEFRYGGETIRQPIGSAGFEATDIKINISAATGQKVNVVSGIAMPGSDIAVFANGMLVGRTRSLLNGTWRLSFELQRPYSFSAHEIHAELQMPHGIDVITEKKFMMYSVNHVEVSKVTMIYPNAAHKRDYIIEFDLKNKTTTPLSYPVWPGSRSYTFLVDFESSNTDILSNVVVNVFMQSGRVHRLPVVYDRDKGLWVGTVTFGGVGFDNNYLPVNVGVEYNASTEIIIDSEMKADLQEYHQAVSEAWQNFAKTFEYTQVENTLVENNGLLVGHSKDMYYLDKNDQEYIIESTFTAKILSVEKFDALIDDYLLMQFFDGTQNYVKVNNKQGQYYLSIIDPLNMQFFETTLSAFTQENESTIQVSPECSTSTSDWDLVWGILSDSGTSIIEDQFVPLAAFNQIRDIIDLGKIRRNQIKINQLYIPIVNELENIANDYCDDFAMLGVNITYLPRIRFGLAADTLTDFIPILSVAPGSSALSKRVNEGIDNISTLNMNINGLRQYLTDMCGAPPSNNNNSDTNANPIHDPAGYIYEAVESNRLPGVTATAFHKDTEEDMYGDVREVIKVWDAYEYGQENPLVTNEIGWYEWDVPVGEWMVRYEKDGYQTAYSTDRYGWLPVPPPQLEVHMGLTSYAQPKITQINGYEDYIEVMFDKYMDIKTIISSNIKVDRNSVPVGVAFEYMDKESDPTDDSRYYAKVVHIKPVSGKFGMSDTVKLTIGKPVSSYSDVEIAAEFSQTIPIKPEPKQIVLPGEINIEYGKTTTIEVSILPLQAAAGKKITAVSGSSYLVTVDAEKLTNTEGKALFTISGELPGSTELEFSVEGTIISNSVKVNVELPAPKKAAKPTANLESGEVAKGTLLTLSTTTPDAIIYYTLDGSCPCAEGTRKKYTEPIAINENMMILAAAFKEGMDYSDTLGLYFIVTQQFTAFSGAILYQPSPLPATISLYTNSIDDPPIATAYTAGDDGAYTLSVPTPQEGARYTLVVTKPGYLSYTVTNLTLTAGEGIEQIDIRQLAGDVNRDGIVNAVDLTCLLSEFNREPQYFRDADIDGNGIVNAADLTYLLAGFNKRNVVEIRN